MNAVATWPSKAKVMLSLQQISLRHIVVLAIVVRVLLPLSAVIITDGEPLFRIGDTDSYIQPAVSLISDGRYALDGESEILRPPGYPALLIPGIVLGHIETVTIGLQIALSTLTVVLVYRIALLLFGRTEIAVIGALLFALDPVSIIYSSRLLSETLFTALIALFLYYFVRYWKQGSLTHLVISAIALTASVYVRPIAYYLPILVSLILLVSIASKKGSKSFRYAHIGIFLLITIGLIGIWQVRNKSETGYSGFSSAVELSLYHWDAAPVLARSWGVSEDEAREQMGYSDEEIYFRNFPEQRGWERSEIIKSMGRQGMEIILGNIGIYSSLAIEGTLTTLLDTGLSHYLNMIRIHPNPRGFGKLIAKQGLVGAVGFLSKETPIILGLVMLLGLALVSTLLLAAFGFIKSGMITSVPMMLIASMAIYFVGLSAVGLGHCRARHPIIPMICVLAGYGLFQAVGNIRAKISQYQADSIQVR